MNMNALYLEGPDMGDLIPQLHGGVRSLRHYVLRHDFVSHAGPSSSTGICTWRTGGTLQRMRHPRSCRESPRWTPEPSRWLHSFTSSSAN